MTEGEDIAELVASKMRGTQGVALAALLAAGGGGGYAWTNKADQDSDAIREAHQTEQLEKLTGLTTELAAMVEANDIAARDRDMRSLKLRLNTDALIRAFLIGLMPRGERKQARANFDAHRGETIELMMEARK